MKGGPVELDARFDRVAEIRPAEDGGLESEIGGEIENTLEIEPAEENLEDD